MCPVRNAPGRLFRAKPATPSPRRLKSLWQATENPAACHGRGRLLMNLRSDPDRWEPKPSDPPDRWAIAKFGIGQPVRRTEDPKLVRGEGRFTDDVGVAGQAYAGVVRSRHAPGGIRAIDVEAARALPGVLGVYTGADLSAASYGTFKCIVTFNNRH